MQPLRPWLLFFVIGGLVFFAWYLQAGSLGVDYRNFALVTRQWQNGAPPYHDYSYQFYNPPWFIWGVSLLLGLGEWPGQVALTLISFCVLIRTWWASVRHIKGYAGPWSLAICFINLHLYDLIHRGQLDALLVLGVLLLIDGWQHTAPHRVGLAWVLIFIKPTSTVLLLPYSAWRVYRDGYLPRAALLPLGVMLASLLVFGAWPLHWLKYYQDVEPQLAWKTCLLRIAQYWELSPIWGWAIMALFLFLSLLALYHWEVPSETWLVNFLLVTSLLITPYALSYHYSILMGLFLPPLLAWRLWLGLPLYALLFTPLLRIPWGVEVAWLDMGFILATWCCYVAWLREVNLQRRGSLHGVSAAA